MFHMGETKEQQAERHRKEGRSEQEIAYFQAENQKDYEPLLKDQNTPEKVISDIVDRITLVPLKVLAFKHPNLSISSKRYMLEKADKKKYQKELIEAFLLGKSISISEWKNLREYYNTAQRLDKIVIELLNEGVDIEKEKLDIILNTLTQCNTKETHMTAYIEAIINHNNFDMKYLTGEFFRDRLLPKVNLREDIMEILKRSNLKNELFEQFYALTNNEMFLPQEAKDLFLF